MRCHPRSKTAQPRPQKILAPSELNLKASSKIPLSPKSCPCRNPKPPHSNCSQSANPNPKSCPRQHQFHTVSKPFRMRKTRVHKNKVLTVAGTAMSHTTDSRTTTVFLRVASQRPGKCHPCWQGNLALLTRPCKIRDTSGGELRTSMSCLCSMGFPSANAFRPSNGCVVHIRRIS